MSVFAVKSCTLKACLNWRIYDKCVKDGVSIKPQIKYIANMHDSSVCEVRRQINQFRLERVLEK